MLPSYLRFALRSFRHSESYASLNVVGLTIGLAASLLILRYVAHETNYDDFHAHAERIFRVTFEHTRGGQPPTRTATVYAGVGPALQAEFPEVETFCRVTRRYGGGVVRFEDRAFREEDVFHADPSFLTLFSFPIVRGDASAALVEPNTAVISSRAARKYFGSSDPLGQTVLFGENEPYRITGVVDVPTNAHLQFDFVFSYQTLERLWETDLTSDWSSLDFLTYIRLRKKDDAASVANRLPAFLAAHRTIPGGEQMSLSLQPLTSIHLTSDLLFEAGQNGDSRIVTLLAGMAVIILLIAWVNYVNLSTARAAKRARETGVRKSVGAHKGQLVSQFLVESLLTNLIAVCLALLLAVALLGPLSGLVGKDLGLEEGSQTLFWALVFCFVLTGTLLSGLYPALVLSSYRPSQVLKGTFTSTAKGRRLRMLLVTVQFASTIVLIGGTTIVYQQLRYMQREDLGVDIGRTLVVDAPGLVGDNAAYTQRFESFKSAVLQSPSVQGVSVSSEVPGSQDPWLNRARVVGSDRDFQATLFIVSVDFDYLQNYRHRLVAGRYLDVGASHDSASVVLNERAVAVLDLGAASNALGEHVVIRGDTLEVVGVVADHHQQGLHQAEYQMAFRVVPDEYKDFSIKLADDFSASTVATIGAIFNRFFPGTPFVHRRLVDLFAAQYSAQERFGLVIKLFAGLSILVACLGLFGLASFTAQQRRKDIGVRKVFGATVAQIVLLLNRDFVGLLVVGALVAVPSAFLIGRHWLEGFAYRVNPGATPYLLSIAITALVALLTVGYHSVRAAMADPIESLRVS